MSKHYGFEDFCKHYNLNASDLSSQSDYEDYCSKLNFLNDLISTNIADKSIQKASKQSYDR